MPPSNGCLSMAAALPTFHNALVVIRKAASTKAAVAKNFLRLFGFPMTILLVDSTLSYDAGEMRLENLADKRDKPDFSAGLPIRKAFSLRTSYLVCKKCFVYFRFE